MLSKCLLSKSGSVTSRKRKLWFVSDFLNFKELLEHSMFINWRMPVPVHRDF